MTLASVAILVAASVAPGATSSSYSIASAPRTLLQTRGPIAGLAHDIGWIAWMAGDPDCLDFVRSRNASRRPTLTLDTFTDVCYAAQRNPAPIAVARQRVLWTAFDIGGNHGYGNVRVGDADGTPNPVDVQSMIWDYVEHGEFMTDAAGDQHLVYATAEITHNYGDDQDACDTARDCRYAVTGGNVFRVAGARRVPVPRAPPAVMLAVSDRSVALVPARRTRTAATPQVLLEPTSRDSVEVRYILNGALVSRFTPSGRILALGLSRDWIAVLVVRGAPRVEIREVDTGRVVKSVPAPAQTDQIGISHSTVVLATRSALYLLDTDSGDVRPLAVAKRPLGVSTRVAASSGRRTSPTPALESASSSSTDAIQTLKRTLRTSPSSTT